MTRRTPPVSGAPPVLRPPTINRHRLDNGLEVVVATRDHLPIIDMELIVRGGAVLDPPLRAGLTSLLAEMIDEGAGERSALELSTAVEHLGIELDARAVWDASRIYLHTLSARLDRAVELFSDIVLRPHFPGDELERKRTERLNALAQEKDEPRTVAMKTLAKAIHGDAHTYGQPISGTPESISDIANADIRAQYERLFVPGAAHLVVAGAITMDDAVALSERLFGGWTPGEPPIAAVAPIVARPITIYLVDRPGAAQSEIRVGHVGPARASPDYFPAIVLNTILGGSFKSRLNMKLREEKGYTYGASSAFAFRRHAGVFTAGAAVFTDNTADAVQIVLEEITQMRAHGATAEESERARNYLSLGFARNFEAVADIVAQLADMALYDLDNAYLGDYPGAVRAVTLSSVAAAAERWLDPGHLAIVVVGDRARIENSLAALGIAPIQHMDA